MVNNRIIKIVQNAMFIAVTLVIAFTVKIPVIPAAPFLKFDISDIPIFICTLISGTYCGISVLFMVTIMRTLLFSTAGWPGFIIRMTSSLVIIFIGYFCRDRQKPFRIFIGVFLGVFICTLIKIPLNYFLWIYFFNLPRSYLDGLIFTVIIPFNIIKSVFNCLAALCLYKPTENILKKVNQYI